MSVKAFHNFLVPGKVNTVIGGQYGSESKGLASQAMVAAKQSNIDVVTTNNAVQSGHTFYTENDQKKNVGFHLPTSGILSPESLIVLNAGAIIDLDTLAEEFEQFPGTAERTVISPRAAIITKEDKEYETNLASGAAKLAGTQKGVGRALARKVMREGTLAEHVVDQITAMGAVVANVDVAAMLDKDATVVMEVPQGYSLSLNSGPDGRGCTSRECTVAQGLNDAGLHPSYVGNTLVALRTFPIRVGNLVVDGQEVGNSGKVYDDQNELSWKDFEQLGVAPELTTVTKRIRRIFTWSDLQFRSMIKQLKPTHMQIGFVNYLSNSNDFELFVKRISEIEGCPRNILWSMSPFLSGAYSQGEEIEMFKALKWIDEPAESAA